jgi:RNA polymerase sigma-70 factor (ECF subfamily)
MSSLVSPEMYSPFTDRLSAMTDELLIPAAKAGDLTAFQELSRRHTDKLHRRIYRLTGNWEDAEDVVQEALLRAFLHLNRFEGRSAFSTWLTRIAINSALMEMRKKRHMVLIDGIDEDGATSRTWEPADTRETPEQHADNREREQLLKEAILRLRPVLRTVVQLRQTSECSMSDIASILGISVPAVKSRMYRARAALRATLQ